MTSPTLRFALFVAIVLALPAALMASADAQLRDLGKLAMILSPAIAGFALAPRSARRTSRVSWRWVSAAAIITLFVALGSLAVAVAVGAASVALKPTPFTAIAGAAGASALTSVLEELGWAAGGLALATAAYGRRWGGLALGTVWAAWHLIPVALHVGLFPYLEAAPPLMIATFVVSCLIYRELLTQLRERSNSWLGAAAGHAAPNILLAGVIAAGVTLPSGPSDWPFFPAPGGIVFPALALVAVLALRPADMRSRALIAFLALPGMVAFLIPGLIAFVSSRPDDYQLLALLPMALGVTGLLTCVRDFYTTGKGTLAVWAPPTRLVTVQLYRVSRNPMYLSVLVLLLGWAWLAGSLVLLAYALAAAAVFHLHVVLVEEPWAARTFGDDWEAYRSTVPRWLGRASR